MEEEKIVRRRKKYRSRIPFIEFSQFDLLRSFSSSAHIDRRPVLTFARLMHCSLSTDHRRWATARRLLLPTKFLCDLPLLCVFAGRFAGFSLVRNFSRRLFTGRGKKDRSGVRKEEYIQLQETFSLSFSAFVRFRFAFVEA